MIKNTQVPTGYLFDIKRWAKTLKPLIYQWNIRRGGDSNPRAPLRTTRFPSVRTRPLCDLSIDKEIDENTNLFSLSCFTEKYY